MTNFSKLTALALAALIASTSLSSAIDFNGPLGIVVENPLDGPKPPHPQGPKPPHPQTISDLDDALNSSGPAQPAGPHPIINNNSSNPDTPAPTGGFKSRNNDPADELLVDCDVAGVEFAASNDLLIKNLGSSDLAAGAKLKFRVRSTGDHGAFLLPKTIRAGKHLVIPGLLHGAVAGAPCDADILF